MKSLPVAGLLIVMALLTACAKPAAPTAVAVDPRAAKDLATYLQLVQAHSDEFAAALGQDIVRRYPNSPQAAEVNKSLPEISARVKLVLDKRRLLALWDYQIGEQSGARQIAASIYSTQPASDRVRLILRRHAAWGQSTYLFGSGKGFECAADCRVALSFDDRPATAWKAHLPSTGEPALFIDDDKAFIAELAKAQRLSIEVAAKGKARQKLLFEVGGYDASRFPQLASK